MFVEKKMKEKTLIKEMRKLLLKKENVEPCLITYSHGLNCYLEREIFLHILDDDDKERQLNTQRFLWIRWTINVGRSHISASYF